MQPWVAKVRHDLEKRAVWTARDLREAGAIAAAPRASDLRALRAGLRELHDPEGKPIAATDLWTLLLDEAPAGALRHAEVARAVQAFGAALAAADAAVERLAHSSDGPKGWPEAVEAVLRIETAFESLARAMKEFS